MAGDSGPGRTLGTEHQVHGLAAQVAGDRGDLILTRSYRVAGATAARRRGPPVPGDVQNRWHALGENNHPGPAATHAVRGTPDAPVRGNDHRHEPGAHIETARPSPGGDGVHRETGHLACLVPVLRGGKAERHGPRCAGRRLPSSRGTCGAPVPGRHRARPGGRRGCRERAAPAHLRHGCARRPRAASRTGPVRCWTSTEHPVHRPAEGGEQPDAHGKDGNPAPPVGGGRDPCGPGARAARRATVSPRRVSASPRRVSPSPWILAHTAKVCEAPPDAAEGSPAGHGASWHRPARLSPLAGRRSRRSHRHQRCMCPGRGRPCRRSAVR